MNRQHPSQQKFFDLFGELEFHSVYAIYATVGRTPTINTNPSSSIQNDSDVFDWKSFRQQYKTIFRLEDLPMPI
jgi:hypothetical protein